MFTTNAPEHVATQGRFVIYTVMFIRLFTMPHYPRGQLGSFCRDSIAEAVFLGNGIGPQLSLFCLCCVAPLVRRERESETATAGEERAGDTDSSREKTPEAVPESLWWGHRQSKITFTVDATTEKIQSTLVWSESPKRAGIHLACSAQNLSWPGTAVSGWCQVCPLGRSWHLPSDGPKPYSNH